MSEGSGGVVVWHIGRCGSTVLGSCLGQHSQIQYDNEILNPWMPARRGDRPIPPLAELLAASRARCCRPWQVVEVKFLACQHPGLFRLDAAGLLQQLMTHGFGHHVVLERANHLRRMVSHCQAARSGVYHLGQTALPSATQPLALPFEGIRVGMAEGSLRHWLACFPQAYAALRASLTAAAVPWLEISYERQIAADPREAYGAVCRWLGLEPEPVQVTLQPTNAAPLDQLLSNHAAVAALLAGTPQAWMLTEAAP